MTLNEWVSEQAATGWPDLNSVAGRAHQEAQEAQEGHGGHRVSKLDNLDALMTAFKQVVPPDIETVTAALKQIAQPQTAMMESEAKTSPLYEKGATTIHIRASAGTAQVRAGEPWSHNTMMRVASASPRVNVVYEDEDGAVVDIPQDWVTITRRNPDGSFISWGLAPANKG